MAAKSSKPIEVEFRSKFGKKKYDSLMTRLVTEGRDLGADDKRVWFFTMSDKLLKVTDNITDKSGKITLKLTKIGKGVHFEEVEMMIEEGDVKTAVKLFTALGYKYQVEPAILRRNFVYQGVELALKYSKTWGYHLEIEIKIRSLEELPKAEEKIRKVAKKLGVKLMSEEELWEFTQKVEKTYRNPKGM